MRPVDSTRQQAPREALPALPDCNACQSDSAGQACQ